MVTLLVGKLYPVRSTFGCVADLKGGNGEHAANWMSEFRKSSGLTTLVYRFDLESSIQHVMEEALVKNERIRDLTEDATRRSGRSSVRIPCAEAVPENSAVDSSASNGKAKQCDQQVEDQVRVGKAALEARLGAQLPCSHPVLRWLIEHYADIMST